VRVVDEPGPQRLVTEEAGARLSQAVGRVGQQEVDPILDSEAFGTEGRRHHRDPLGERLQHLEAGATAEPEGHHDQVG
jgi:hypothetical protein